MRLSTDNVFNPLFNGFCVSENIANDLDIANAFNTYFRSVLVTIFPIYS